MGCRTASAAGHIPPGKIHLVNFLFIPYDLVKKSSAFLKLVTDHDDAEYKSSVLIIPPKLKHFSAPCGGESYCLLISFNGDSDIEEQLSKGVCELPMTDDIAFYIKKFTDICEKSHVWKLEYNDDEIDPFEVDVRGLSRENVAFLKASDRKFVTAKLIDFMQTSYVKNLRELEFTGNYTAESLKTLKSNYLRTFYIHEVMQVESNGSFAISDVNLEEAERIPTYISLKFRLIENAVGLGNSDARVIRQMAENMFGNEDDGETEISETFSAIDIEYPETDCDSCEIQEDQVVYHVNGKQVIGHKIN